MERQSRYYVERRLDRKAKGLCAVCGREPLEPGKAACRMCLDVECANVKQLKKRKRERLVAQRKRAETFRDKVRAAGSRKKTADPVYEMETMEDIDDLDGLEMMYEGYDD